MKRPYFIDPIKDTCIARNGERCKDCVYYGKPCSNWKRAHRGRKPSSYDGIKNDIMGKYPGLSQVYNKNANITQKEKEIKNNGIKEKRRNHERDHQS